MTDNGLKYPHLAPLYRARANLEHLTRWGTEEQVRAAAARVRELESAPPPVVPPTPAEKKQGKHWDKFLYGKRRAK